MTAQGWAGLVLIIVWLAIMAGLAIHVVQNSFEVDRRRRRLRRYASREANKAAGRCADCDEGRPRDRWD